MKVMVFVKATKESEAGAMPDEKTLASVARFNEELVRAGVMLGGEGLHPSRRGKRVHIADGRTTVVDGPFAEAKELVGGYWIWQVESMDEAVEWLKKSPFRDGTVELRRVYEEADFADGYPQPQ
jgi:hypothetical protein